MGNSPSNILFRLHTKGHITDEEYDKLKNAITVARDEKIIRCIDCKYYHPFKHWCDCHEDWAGGEDGFCSLAKMKGGAE